LGKILIIRLLFAAIRHISGRISVGSFGNFENIVSEDRDEGEEDGIVIVQWRSEEIARSVRLRDGKSGIRKSWTV
jgi:hypothetical protein